MPNEVKLLPCEPTPEMASAGMHIIAALPADSGWPELTRAACDVYRAMAKAAPTTVVTDEVVERVARAIWVAEGHGAETMYEHNEHEKWPVDRRDEYVGLGGEPRVMLMHYGWRKREKQARAALASMPTVVTGEQPIQSVGDHALPPSGLSQSSLSQASPAAAIARKKA